MTREDVELTILKYVPKVLDRKVYCRQFSVKGAVLHLNLFELAGKIGDRATLVLNKLL